MSNITEFKKLSQKEMPAKLAAMKLELFNTKFQKHTTGIQKPHVLKNLKKDIARLQTVMNEKKK
jgi:large subunit ribosomal protein L29